MNRSSQTREGTSARPMIAKMFKSASAAFESASKSMVMGVALMASTLSAVSLPFDEAIDFLKQKVATTTSGYRDVWNGAHSKMFMVAGANKQALVDDFKSEILKALEKGTTLEDFRAGFDDIVKRHGWSYNGDRGWRTRTIFETNLRTAYAAGRYAQMTEPDTLATFPYWQYHHSGAVHPRLQHKAWDGTTLRADDPFWSVAYPPNGYGCGCFVTPVSRGGLRRMGKAEPDRAPDLDQLGTDQPLGVDPSFAYNPGKSWLDQTAPGPKAITASEANIAAFVQSSLRGKWPDGSWTPVGVTTSKNATSLDLAAGTELRLPASTIRDNADTDVSPDAYAVVPKQLLKKGRVKRDEKTGAVSLVGDVDGERWAADLDFVEGGKRRQLHIKSLRRERKP
ncbi:phage minor head protein [Rhizobium sp.]|uniref:phage minor head protein n=1 Tax=Rhizobium sp. TaxID=391 RepID=UPI003F803175